MSQDLNALRNWVTAESGGQARGETTVRLAGTERKHKLRAENKFHGLIIPLEDLTIPRSRARRCCCTAPIPTSRLASLRSASIGT